MTLEVSNATCEVFDRFREQLGWRMTRLTTWPSPVALLTTDKLLGKDIVSPVLWVKRRHRASAPTRLGLRWAVAKPGSCLMNPSHLIGLLTKLPPTMQCPRPAVAGRQLYKCVLVPRGLEHQHLWSGVGSTCDPGASKGADDVVERSFGRSHGFRNGVPMAKHQTTAGYERADFVRDRGGT